MNCVVDGCARDRSPKAGYGMCAMHYRRKKDTGTTELTRPTLEERFWSKVVRPSLAECWGWAGSKSHGYGQMSSGLGRGNAPLKAHRLSYELHYGPVPKGLEVCHSCDNPECSNPLHLWLGTHHDNMRDAANKGRIGRHPNSINNLRPGSTGHIGATPIEKAA
jgi:hypothetical protein